MDRGLNTLNQKEFFEPSRNSFRFVMFLLMVDVVKVIEEVWVDVWGQKVRSYNNKSHNLLNFKEIKNLLLEVNEDIESEWIYWTSISTNSQVVRRFPQLFQQVVQMVKTNFLLFLFHCWVQQMAFLLLLQVQHQLLQILLMLHGRSSILL